MNERLKNIYNSFIISILYFIKKFFFFNAALKKLISYIYGFFIFVNNDTNIDCKFAGVGGRYRGRQCGAKGFAGGSPDSVCTKSWKV